MQHHNDLVSLCEWRQKHQFDKVAFDFVVKDQLEGTTITYGELAISAKSICVGLKPGVTKGNRVILMLPPGLNLIKALIGVFYSGGIVSLIPPPLSDKDRIFTAAVIEDMHPDAIITNIDYISRISVFLEAKGYPTPVFSIEELLLSDPQLWEPIGDLQDEPCLFQYTSGSSGNPKGVVISHRNIMHNSLVIQQSFFNNSKSYGVIWLPPYHDMGLIGGIIQPIYVGFPTTLLSPRTFLQKPIRWLRLISHKKATCSGGPNFAYDLCVKHISEAEKEGLDLRQWNVAFNGAEPVKSSVIESFSKAFKKTGFKKKAFMPCYGLAESTLFVTANLKTEPPTILPAKRSSLINNSFVVADPQSDDFTNLVSCGLPYFNETIRIVNPKTRIVCRSNEIGEIWVASESKAVGYWNQAEETMRTFKAHLAVPDGKEYLRTGDLGFLHRSELFVTGRLKDLIIIRGANHIPEDIEHSYQQSHNLLAKGKGVAIAVPSDEGEFLVIINEIAKEGKNGFDGDAIFEAIRVSLFNKHKLNPSVILLVKPGDIPRTRNGKLQRNRSSEMFLMDEFDELARWEDQNAPPFTLEEISIQDKGDEINSSFKSLDLTERNFDVLKMNIIDWMADAIGSQVSLDPSEIDHDMHFGLYGLDSLSAAQILVEFEKEFGKKELSETLLWDYPNLNALGDYLVELVKNEQKHYQDTN